MVVPLEFRPLHISRKQRDAFGRFHTGEPKKWQSTGVQRAIFRSDANAHHLLRFQPKEHDKTPRSFELDAPIGMRGAAVCVMISFQAASPAPGVIAPIAAADAPFARNFIDAVAD